VIRPRLAALRKDVPVLGVDEFHHVPAEDLRLVPVAVQGEPGRVDVDHPAVARDAHGLHGVLEQRPVFPLRLREGLLGPLAVRDVPQDGQDRRRGPVGVPQGHVGHAVEEGLLPLARRERRVAAVDLPVLERPEGIAGIGLAGPRVSAQRLVALAALAAHGEGVFRLLVVPDHVEVPVDHDHAVADGPQHGVELPLARPQGLLGALALLHLGRQLQVRLVELGGPLLHPALELLARPAQLLLRFLEGQDGALELRIDALEFQRRLLPGPLEEIGKGRDDEKGGDEAQLEIAGVRREGARRVFPHEERDRRNEHHERRGQPRPRPKDERGDQGVREVPDVGRVVHPAGEQQVIIQDPHDYDRRVEGPHVVLRPAKVDDQIGQDQSGAVIQRGEPWVSLNVGQRAQQDEIEDADQGEGVEDDNLARNIRAEILSDPSADQIEGDPLEFLHVQGHGLVPAPGRSRRWGCGEIPLN